jgi:hypothetical protein
MRVMGWLLVACVMMALLKLALALMVFALSVLLLWGAINRPGEAMAILVLLSILSIVRTNPAAFLGLIGIVLAACLIGKAIER